MKHTYILVLILFPLSLLGQIKPQQAPLNPDFTNQADKIGYINPPHRVKHQGVKTKGSEILPSSFDLRNVNGTSYLPDIKNQNPYGTCWAFATYASIESGWKVAGDASFTDLSVGHMAKCHGYIFGIDDGGNEYMSTAYLSRLAGPVYESADPYSEVNTPGCPDIDKNTDIPAYIDNILWLGDDRNILKKMVMEHGALSTSMNADFSDSYYNSSDFTYYYNGTEGINHGVAIIGWDDNKTVTGGTSGAPQAPGAWIIRNSWGTGSSDNGYFYASYEDKHIGRSSELYYGKTPVTEIDTLFDDAKLGAITSFSAGAGSSDIAYAAVKHHANADYFVTHIGAAVLYEGTSIDITLCKSFDNTTFTDTIAHISDVYCPYAGYQKIEFPAVVLEGDFYLIVRYYTPNDNFPLPAETEVIDYCYPEIKEGKLWISPDGLEWSAGGLNTDAEFDLAVKIIAKHMGEIQPYFSTSSPVACLNQDVSFKNLTIGEADSFLWYFPEDTFLTNSKEESITLPFNNVGHQKITLVAYKDGTAHTFSRDKAVSVVDEISSLIRVAGASDFYSKGQPIILLGSGGESYQWFAQDYLNGESGRSITFSPDVDSIWVRLEASMGTCFDTDSILLKMVDVPHDNIEDALLLSLDIAAEDISNAYASVQKNEPTPTIGSCDSQNSWCEEGGLQNSIWFKFYAPASGEVSITTTGFDNQIALYDATATGSWEDILSGDPLNYNIIAANDDYHTVDYSAKITSVNSLTPNATYWIQMDGSGGGQVGKIRIIVSSSSTALLEINKRLNLGIINTNEEFHVRRGSLKDATISIVNSMGQIVFHEDVNTEAIHTSGQHYTNGFYLVSIKSQGFNQVYKVIISKNWQLSIDAE